jgi:hypothetical protein
MLIKEGLVINNKKKKEKFRADFWGFFVLLTLKLAGNALKVWFLFSGILILLY